MDDQRSGVRALASYVVFPALLVGPLAAAWLGLSLGLPHLAILLGCLVGCLAVQLVLERVMPFRIDWNHRRRHRDDVTCMGLNAITQRLVETVLLAGGYAAAAALSDGGGGALWPTGWPAAAQLILVVLIADAGHYVAHRAMHEVPALWAFHQMHHSPNSLDSLNFFRMHPVDIVLKSVANMVPLILLGAPADVLLLWMILSGVSAGALNHANIELRTGWLDGVLSTPHLHRFHHSRRPEEGRCNLGNITVIFDRLLGTHCRPPGRAVAEVGEPGGARPLIAELLSPLTRRGDG